MKTTNNAGCMPYFTGRNVPLDEIAAAIGLSVETVRNELICGDFSFGILINGKRDESAVFYCSDKKVWEETGYFNDKFAIGEQNDHEEEKDE